MKEVLVDFKEFKKRIFWEAYSQSEIDKTKDKKNAQTTSKSQLFCGFCQVFSFDYWKKITEELILTDPNFWSYYFKETNKININIMILNLLSLSIFYFSSYFSGRTEDKQKQTSVVTGLSYVTIWFVSSCLCLSFFVIYHFSQISFIQTLKLDLYSIWQHICITILACRLLIVVQGISYLLFHEEESCYGSYLLPIDNIGGIGSFVFAFYLDIYQTFVFSTLPIPSYLIISLSFLISFESFIRIITCAELIQGIDRIRIILLFFFLSFSFSLIIFNVSFTLFFERNMLASYTNLKNQSISMNENNKLVSLLCRELKTPVQTLHHVTNFFQSKLPTQLPHFDEQVSETSYAINSLVDSNVFLLKVLEKRLIFKANNEIDVKDMLSKVLTIVKSSLDYSYNLEQFIQLDCKESKVIQTDEMSLRTLLYYSFMAIVSLLGEEIILLILEDRVSTKLTPSTSTIDEHFEDTLPTRQIYGNSNIQIRTWTDPHIQYHIESGQLPCSALCVELRWDSILKDFPIFQHVLSPKKDIDKNINLLKMMTSERNMMFESIVAICNKIALTYQGYWRVYYDRIEFTIPAYILKSLQSNKPEDILLDKNQFLSYLTEHVCFFITDSVLESFITDFRTLLKLPIAESSVIDPVDLKILSIILVQNIEASKLLRSKGFQGDIILCSEKLFYIDNTDESLITYSIPLPCTEEDKNKFLVWLKRKIIGSLPQETSFSLDPSPVLPRKTTVLIQSTISLKLLSTKLPLTKQSSSTPTFLSYFFPFLSRLYLIDLENNDANNDILSIFFHSLNSIRIFFVQNFLLFYFSPMYSYPLEDYDNYAKWRTLNPGRQIIHHKNTFLLLLIVLFFFDILMFLFEYVPPSLLLFKFLSYLIFALNKIMIVEKLTDRLIGYRRLMNFVGVAVTVLTFLGALTEFVRFYIIHHKYDADGNRIFLYRAETLSHDQCDFNLFLSTAFGSYNGIYSLLTLFNSSILMKGYVYLTSWPFTIPCVLISVVRGMLVIAYVIKPCFDTSRANILLTLLFLFSFKLLRLSVHTELLYQKEFIELRNSILSTDFLKKIRFLSNKSLFLSIQNLNNLQIFFLEELTKMATTNTIAITEEYLPFIGLLNKNVLITTELTMNMNIEHYLKNGFIPSPVKQQSFATFNAFVNELSPRTVLYNNKNNLMTQMKAHFLTNLISQVGEHFTMLQPHDLFKVKVFCYCDPLVCMVRIDAVMLKVLLGHACQQIIERIQNTITISPEFKSKDKQHEIFIWVQPYDFEQNSCQLPFPENHTFKFQDTRLLDILVLDTGLLHGIQPYEQVIPTPLNRQNPKRLFSIHNKQKQFIIFEENFKHQTKSLGDQYLAIFGFPMTFHQGIINHPHYHSFQRFGMPYLLCPDSVRISALKENELGNTKIYPITSNTITLHSLYKKAWEKAFNLAYQYHKLFHLSKEEKSLYLSLNALDEYPEFHYDANDIIGSILAMGSDAFFFHYSDGRCNKYSKTFHQYFNRHSWQLKFVSYSQHNMFTFQNNATTANTNTNKTNTNHLNQILSNTSFFQNSECILLEYDPQNKRQIISIREYIHMFRTKDFKGLIGIVYHDNGPSSSSANYHPLNKGPGIGHFSPNNESDNIEIRGLFPKNNYTDADSPDFVLRFPLTQESVDVILLKCEQHLIKRMIQTAIN